MAFSPLFLILLFLSLVNEEERSYVPNLKAEIMRRYSTRLKMENTLNKIDLLEK
jgi:hypothetical protein